MRLNTLIRRIERVRDEVVPAVKAACEKESAWIVSANKEQLAEGVNAEGELMNNGFYSRIHKQARMSNGFPVDHVYLAYLTGDFQREMYVEYSDTGFAVQSRDWKNENAMYSMEYGLWPSGGKNWPRYGKVYGLTAEKRGELARRIAPSVARTVRRRLLNA